MRNALAGGFRVVTRRRRSHDPFDTLSATFVYQVANTTLKNPTWIDGSTIAFAESGEIYTVQFRTAHGSSGEPDFTVTGTVEVTYS